MAGNEGIAFLKGGGTVRILTQHWLARCLRHCLSFYMRCQADLLLVRFSASIADILLTVALRGTRLYEDLQHSHPFFFS